MLQGFILLVCVYACETPWNGTVSKRESFCKSAAVWGWWIGCTPVYRGQMIHRYLRRVVCSRCLWNMCQKFRFHVSPIAAGTQKQKRETEKWEPLWLLCNCKANGQHMLVVALDGQVCQMTHGFIPTSISIFIPSPISISISLAFAIFLHFPSSHRLSYCAFNFDIWGFIALFWVWELPFMCMCSLQTLPLTKRPLHIFWNRLGNVAYEQYCTDFSYWWRKLLWPNWYFNGKANNFSRS